MNLRIWVTLAVVLAVPFLLFSGTIGHEFVNWDDDIYVYDNPRIQTTSGENILWLFTHVYYYAYIPVTMLSHALDYAVWGLDPRGHHLTNVILHALNAGWVFLLILYWVASKPRGSNSSVSRGGTLFGAAVGALLFAVHPLRVESVAWVSDRKDLLCAFFLIPSLITYLLSQRATKPTQRKRWVVVSVLLFVAALLSKFIAVVFPVVLFLIDLYFEERGQWKHAWRHKVAAKLPYAIPSVVVACVSLFSSPGAKTAYIIDRLSGADVVLFPFYSLFFYIQKTLLPFGLYPIYLSAGSGVMILALGVAVIITAACVVLLRRGRPAMALVWLLFVIMLLPTILGLSSGMQPFADRFSYLPTIGFFVVLGIGVGAVWGLSAALRIGVTLLSSLALILLSTLSLGQISTWTNSVTLWSHVVESFPPQPDFLDAYINLGTAYANTNRLSEAEAAFEKAVTVAPGSSDAYYNLGYMAYIRGDREKSLELFTRATAVDSTYAKGFFNIAVVQSQFGNRDEALAAMRQAARLGHIQAQQTLRSMDIKW